MGDVIMQAAYRVDSGTSVPAPSDRATPGAPWWWDHVAAQCHAWAQAGFTKILAPPFLKTQSGSFPTGDGYGPYDDYDIGSKDQCGSVPTRFGNREQLQRMIAVAKANGLDVLGDIVLHQRAGGRNGAYTYTSATGETNGRFPKTVKCFVGNPPRNPRQDGDVDGPANDDFAFGDEFSTLHSIPENYVKDGLIDAGDWLTQSLGLEGYRIDDVKGQSHRFLHPYLTGKSQSGKLAMGEYFDGNPSTLDWYVWESGMAGVMSVFDFTAHFALRAMCNNNSAWDMQQLQNNGGYFQRSPFKAVTFVENPDTDTDGFATVIWNKILGYAWVLLNEGLPCVYYKDYSTDPGCYGLKQWIDNLIWIRQQFTDDRGTTFRSADFQTYVFERDGGLLVALNNDRYNSYLRTVETGFGPNVRLHDYTGHAANDIWTDPSGNATIYLPPNDNGHGYVAFGRAGNDAPIALAKKSITQVFYGAKDLDIAPLDTTRKTVGRIWCDEGTDIHVSLAHDPAAPAPTVSILDDTGARIALNKLRKTGWYSVAIQAIDAKSTGSAFALSVTYTASQEIA